LRKFYLSEKPFTDNFCSSKSSCIECRRDNDDIGFAFGFNGENDTYIWSWDKGGVSNGGVRSGGAHLLYKKTSSSSSSSLPGTLIDKGPNNDPWAHGVTYQIEILYTENKINIKVNGVLKLEATPSDAGVTKFPAGKFGFYNFSQGGVTFGNIQKAQGSDNQTPPSAQDDSYGMSPDDNTLTVNSLDGILKNDYDANLDDFSIVKVSDVSNGSLSLNTSDGSFTYTPTAGYQGPDEFTYKLVQDDNLTESAVRTVTIGIINNNQTPTDIQLSNSTISEGAVNNTDIGTLTTTDSNQYDRHDYSLSDNASGRFTVIGNNLVVANSSLLTPGNYTITVKTTDLFGLSHSENFTISVIKTTMEVIQLQFLQLLL
jgi:hypothetical protein